MAKGQISDDEEEEFEDREDVQEPDGGADRASDEEEEDEEEGQDEYEKDGFIVDEDEDEEPEEEEEEEEEEVRESSDEEAKARKKKRKKRNEENDELDEDDYELLREHNVFHRPKSGNKTKFKRLKKAGKTGGDDDRGSRRGLSDDEDEEEEGSRRGRTAEEELKRSLFGDDEGLPPDDVGEEEEREEEEEEEIGEEDDEMADFIVDEEEGEDDGQPFRRKKAKKKKAPRQAPGISSFALQEAQDIFGDVSALLDERRQRELEAQKAEMDLEDEDDGGFGRRKPSKLLEKQFEPSLLEEKFMTEKDDQIRDMDVAERLQLLEEVVGSFPPPETATKEASWIYERAFARDALWKRPEFERLAIVDKEDLLRQIANVLRLLHEEKMELPFIAMYRQEQCPDLLQEPDDRYRDDDGGPKLKHYEGLWAVQHWDKKWLLLRRRKVGLEGAYEKRNLYESRKGSGKEELFQRLLQALSEAQSEQVVDDVDAKFNLHFPPDEIDVEPSQFKRPKRRSFYSVCRKAGLGLVARRFGLTPEEFGENISSMYKRHEVEDDASTPEEVASGYLGGEFREPLTVLKGARHMAVVEISTEPAVREYVRHVYMDKVLISTRPTQEGNTVIDTFHQYATVKWLQNKPLDKFDDAQWLLIQKAEEEKLLEVTIGLAKTVVADNLMPEFETVYLSEGVSGTVQLWNEQRKEILKDALLTMLLPAMEKEARMVLTLRSKQWVAAQCAKELWNKVSVGPYVDLDPEKPEEHFDLDGAAPRVMACCWGPGKPATTFVMLDAAGEIVNILYTGYLTIRGDNHEQQERKKQDVAKLLDFMMENQPHVVVLGAANLSCRRMKTEIFEVVFKIVEDHPRDLAEGLNTIGVVYGDETIPRLYENSHISEEQLVGHPGNVRRAVALGRYLQNPLAMVATLCGPGKEVLSLRLHSLQNFLALDEVYETVERIMLTVTNQVGVDVNLAASHDWLFAPLQFVSGLGPRKASYIQRSIQGVGRVNTRRELLTTLRLMGRKIFINSAGFIRVRGTGQASSGNQIMDPLDDTRIHPEAYDIAKRMAEDAYCEVEGTKAEDMDEDALELAIEHVKRHPHLLEVLNLDGYASHLAKDMRKLQMIKMELQHGYQELRNPCKPLSQDEEFHLLSGESEDTLAEGFIVQATVRKVQQSRVMCVLESGLMGFINKDDISDESNVDPADKVSEGTIVTCRVKGINKASYQVDLTCKGSALRGDNWAGRRPKDPYFSPDMSVLRNEQEKAKKKSEEEKRTAFKPRMIVHPQFQNVSLADAVQALADKDVGEVVIRPSSRGPSHLSMTLKFFDGVYVHIDIVEGGKDSRDITSFLRLGKTLTIGDETFEDLDEVIARYVDPLVSHLKEVLRYRKFKRGSKMEVDEALRDEKTKNPMRIPYFFSVCHEHPGAFRLSYIKNVHTVSHEYISVSPKGLKFRKRLFDGTDKLVSYFQKHFSDPIPDVAPRRAMAAMVPPRSPAPSAGGSYQSGQWGPQRSGEGATSTGWDSSSGWDRSGGRGRNSGSWGQGAGASGTSTSWDQQARGGSSFSGGWAPPPPPSQGGGGWNGWAGPAAGGYGRGRGAPGPPGGQSNWDKSQQGQRGGFKSGANGWGHDSGFTDGPSLTPVPESSWASRKTTPATGGSDWDSAASTWEQPSSRTPARSGWDSEPGSHGPGSSGWLDAPLSRTGWDKSVPSRAGTSGWEQSRGDPRRAGAGREGPKQVGSGWDQRTTKEGTASGWEASDPTSQSGGSSALWEASANSNARKGVGSTWDSPAVKEATPTGWETSEQPSQSGGSSALWEAPVNSNARKGVGETWDNGLIKEAIPTGWQASERDKPEEQPTQSESEWTSTEPESERSGWAGAASNKGDSGWAQPSSSPAESGWGVSQSDNWDSSDGGERKPHGGNALDNISQGQDSGGWDHPVGSKDRDSNWEKQKEKSASQSGWDAKEMESGGVGRNDWDTQPRTKPFGGDRQRADPRRAGSGWDQQARGGPSPGGWDRAAGKGGRSNWYQPATYSPATQSGASYSPTQSGWSTDWDKTPVKTGAETANVSSSKTSPDIGWTTEPEFQTRRSSGWDSKEPGAPGVPESNVEPAAPGTADPTAVVSGGTRPPHNSSTGPPKDRSLPWVWSGAA